MSVDVIIPSRNGMPYLSQAVESVLRQTHSNLSLYVIDGESSDDSVAYLETIKDDRLRWYSTPRNWTPAARRNFGVLKTSGEFLMFLDSDDILEPNALAELCSSLTLSDWHIAVGGLRRFDQKYVNSPDGPTSHVEYGPAIGNVLMPRRIFVDVGSFSESLAVGEFVEWITRAKHAGIEQRPTGTLVLHRREHDKNRSKLLKSHYSTDYPEILRSHLQRMRNQE